MMRAIDIHAHVIPAELTHLAAGKEWHGFRITRDSLGQTFLEQGNCRALLHPNYFWPPEQRLAHMDSIGVDIQVISPWTPLNSYPMPEPVGVALSRACNDHIAEITRGWPSRFVGLGTLPMHDVSAAIVELERGMMQLGLKGAIINDDVNGKTYDAPEFGPFWQAAEQLEALILFHPAEGNTVVDPRSRRYDIGNSVGSPCDLAITFATLVLGGVLDRHPQLKLCLCHAGGYAVFGAGRMDRGWQVRKEARANINQPPSAYLRSFYYDCITHSEAALRFIIDAVGADRVLLGSDWPHEMGLESPVQWIMQMQSLTPEEKEAILWKNFQNLLKTLV